MKRIVQCDDNGCGAACVAIVACVDYPDAVKRVGTKSTTKPDQLRAALQFYGITLGEPISASSVKFSDLKADGLMYARLTPIKGNKGGWNHWLVWDDKRQAIIDPSNSEIGSYRSRLRKFFPISRRGG
jgi:hypothetical protein